MKNKQIHPKQKYLTAINRIAVTVAKDQADLLKMKFITPLAIAIEIIELEALKDHIISMKQIVNNGSYTHDYLRKVSDNQKWKDMETVTQLAKSYDGAFVKNSDSIKFR